MPAIAQACCASPLRWPAGIWQDAGGQRCRCPAQRDEGIRSCRAATCLLEPAPAPRAHARRQAIYQLPYAPPAHLELAPPPKASAAPAAPLGSRAPTTPGINIGLARDTAAVPRSTSTTATDSFDILRAPPIAGVHLELGKGGSSRFQQRIGGSEGDCSA